MPIDVETVRRKFESLVSGETVCFTTQDGRTIIDLDRTNLHRRVAEAVLMLMDRLDHMERKLDDLLIGVEE
jgi:hypothetical protein